MSALFKMPDAAQSPAGKPIPDTPDIAPGASASQAATARQSFVGQQDDKGAATFEGEIGALPASTGFNQRLQNTGVGPTTVVDDRRPKLGRLPRGLYGTAQDDNEATAQRTRASVATPGQLPADVGAGDIAAAAQRISQLGAARRFASASRPSGAVVIRDLIRYGRGMKP